MKTTEFVCRACGAQNRLSQDGLLKMTHSPACGRCRTRLLPGYGDPLQNLEPSCYVHDLDRQALDALHRIPGIQTLLRALLKRSVELGFRLFHQANFVRVTERQLPQIKILFEEAAHAIGVQELPELYVLQDPQIQAYTYGVEKALIAVSSGAVDLMERKELLAILAHELGHWQCDHVLYKTAASLIGGLASGLASATLGLGNLALLPVRLALLRWDRASELTADRAALLAVREPEILLRVLMKMAGGSAKIYAQMDFEAFLLQAQQFEELKEEGWLSRFFVTLDNLFRTHPYPVWRASEIVRWIHEGSYLKILAGEYPRREQVDHNCRSCGKPAQPGASLCAECLATSDEAAAEDTDEKDGNAWDRTMHKLKNLFE